MAPNLPDLPGELLLNIVEQSQFWEHMGLISNLRAVCREMNAKLVYIFGCFTSKLFAARILGAYIQSLSVDVTILLTKTSRESETDSSDASECSWYPEEIREAYMLEHEYFKFDEAVTDFVLNGSFVNILGQSLITLPNLQDVSIQPPFVRTGIKHNKPQDIRSRWSIVVESTLT
ncbi:hypothetical protein CC86DRAFT_403004 [Ophiobolus disseminans]|uniref:Uncharacterized protein n=1 Tax=Ophiobolus disseminans TaxID=1469910 RepID=A0A6A7AAH1_9PLEO|nr:hypothetical protein CC86DRAFT_403004 [Ophiobolus disseminans]